MSIDPKKFGLSDALLGAVNEALKGGQVKLDKNHNGKLDSQDFKMLRKEDAKPDYLDFDKDGNKKEPMKKALKQAKEEVEVSEAAPAGSSSVADQLAAKKDALKTQIQRKIAQKQMSTMQAKANKRISNINASNDCGSENDKSKKMKGGKEPI